MQFSSQQRAIDYIRGKFEADPDVLALLLSGSISHGFHGPDSDVDINIVVTDAAYENREARRSLTFWESAEQFYEGGYFDGKFITLGYLRTVSERGNEPTRFALADAKVAFDKTGELAACLREIARYPIENEKENTIRFLSQLEAWKWYCEEAIKKDNLYLLDVSVTKFILFAGRLILLHNRTFFPYHKWFLRVLEDAPKKPKGFMSSIQTLLKYKTLEHVQRVYDDVLAFTDWTQGENFSWTSNFVRDIETNWMRQSEFIENI